MDGSIDNHRFSSSLQVVTCYLMEPSRASSEKEFKRLISSIVRTFDYFGTTLDLQTKVLSTPTKRFAQQKTLVVLNDRTK